MHNSLHSSALSLRIHRFLLRFALGAAHVFAWIFVFQYFYVISPDPSRAFARTALLFALSQSIIALATPLASRSLRHGARSALVRAAVILSASLVILGATFTGIVPSSLTAWGITAFAIGLGLYRALYWVPYAVEAEHAREARPGVAWDIVVALAPLLAGFLLVSDPQAPVWLLFIAAAAALFSIVPLSRVRDVPEKFSWGYRETYGKLIARENRKLTVPAFLDGLVGAALLFVWPIAIFLIIGWSYSMLGIILSMTVLIGLLVRRFVRTAVRNVSRDSALLNGILAVSPWLLRLAVATPLGVVLVDSYFYTTTPRRLGMDPLIFEQSADAGTYVDEYTALKEIALALGKITMCAFSAVLALYFTLPFALIGVFLAAALASILSIRSLDK